MTIPDGDRNTLGSDGRWMLSIPAQEQIQLLTNAGFEPIHATHVQIYNGKDWLCTLSRKLSTNKK